MSNLPHLAPIGFEFECVLDLRHAIGALEYRYRHRDRRLHIVRLRDDGTVTMSQTFGVRAVRRRTPAQVSREAAARAAGLARGNRLTEPGDQLLEAYRPIVPAGFEPEMAVELEEGQVEMWYRRADGARHKIRVCRVSGEMLQ